MFLNRAIAYTKGWLNTFFVSAILAVIVVFIIVFLKPFDSLNDDVLFQQIKLVGYSLCIVIPIMMLHLFENLWFAKTKEKWFVYQELVILVVGFLFISATSYFYNTYVVNDMTMETNYIFQWMMEFGLPFTPIFMPLWIYLRFRFSKVVIQIDSLKKNSKVTITGANRNEELSFMEGDFILAKAQSNYVDIFFLEDGKITKKMIRTTLSNLVKLIPSAQQIHRSYLVNPQKIERISGNTRKGYISINAMEEPIPISPKHFLGVKNYLQNRP